MSDTFPVDDVSLSILRSSCEIGDDGQSHLFDALDFGDSRWSPHAVIIALIDEIERLRVSGDQEGTPHA